MVAKKKKGRKMPKWKRWVKAIIGVAGTGVGATIALSPTFHGIGQLAANPQEGARAIVFDTTGVDINAPAMPDVGKILGTAAAVGAGIGIMAIFKYFAKRV